MPTTLPHALQTARTDWLAGDRTAWARYVACLRQLDAADRDRRSADRPRARRRPRRPRAQA